MATEYKIPLYIMVHSNYRFSINKYKLQIFVSAIKNFMFCDTATRDLVQDQIVTRKQHFYFIRNNDYSEASLYIKKSNTCVCVRYLSLNRSI